MGSPQSSRRSAPTGWWSPGFSPRARPRRRTPPWRGSCARRARAAEAGLRLGFHNHDAEVAAQADGRSVLDLLLAADDGPFLELDLGWAWYAGADPLMLLATAGSRAPLVHVKDMRRDGGPVHVPLGRGDVDYRGLADAANRAGVEWLIVEQDETDGEAFEAVADSLARLRSLVEVPA